MSRGWGCGRVANKSAKRTGRLLDSIARRMLFRLRFGFQSCRKTQFEVGGVAFPLAFGYSLGRRFLGRFAHSTGVEHQYFPQFQHPHLQRFTLSSASLATYLTKSHIYTVYTCHFLSFFYIQSRRSMARIRPGDGWLGNGRTGRLACGVFIWAMTINLQNNEYCFFEPVSRLGGFLGWGFGFLPSCGSR